jgi:hypothetical protein
MAAWTLRWNEALPTFGKVLDLTAPYSLGALIGIEF